MRFQDKIQEFHNTLEFMCLIVSLGAVFLQIWLLISAIQAYFEHRYDNILPAVMLSGVAFLACALSAWLTGVDPLKGIRQGRTKTYHKISE